jgi:hypothetical protein
MIQVQHHENPCRTFIQFPLILLESPPARSPRYYATTLFQTYLPLSELIIPHHQLYMVIEIVHSIRLCLYNHDLNFPVSKFRRKSRLNVSSQIQIALIVQPFRNCFFKYSASCNLVPLIFATRKPNIAKRLSSNQRKSAYNGFKLRTPPLS